MLGAHERGVRCVEWLAERGALATASWDASLRVWDPRLAPARPRARESLGPDTGAETRALTR